MKLKYLHDYQLDKTMCKPLLKRTCKERYNKFRYYEVLDDFGDVVKRLPWYTDKYTLLKLNKTRQLVKVMLKYEEIKDEECLM